ncbi:tRNA(Ser) Um(44) 2'-O-methyltransferase [Microbotryomycetes sp. JL201]|nr:tRNA(Ser) Um(44) 2'-O-methyltransferase [Microbotryomycetes sp. JL201]
MPPPRIVDKGKATFVPTEPSQDGPDAFVLGTDWLGVLECPASQFDPSHFYEAIMLQVMHPEYNSTTILRSDVLVDERFDQEPGLSRRAPQVNGLECTRRIRRRLIPKQTRDQALEQECWIYNRSRPEKQDSDDSIVDQARLLVLDVDLDYLERENHRKMPYYHPTVASLAFSYIGNGETATIRLDLRPLPSEPLPRPLPASHRLYRTGLALLRHLHSVAIGTKNGYEKRVNHDLLTDRDTVQDLYHELKEKYRADIESSLVDARITFRWMLHEWKEVTDPTKHVWEDVAIAAWLMVLWRGMYPESGGKPPGGFVDVGCGNGLLVYLLSCEGFSGYGVDLRARKSWEAYSPSPDLRTTTLDPPTMLSLPGAPFPDSSFLIGNHADELTPWIPLFAARSTKCSFLNIPCCLHTHTTRFTAQEYTIPGEFVQTLPKPRADFRFNASGPGKDKLILVHPLIRPFFEPTPALFASDAVMFSKENANHASNAVTLSTKGRSDAYQLYLSHIMLQCGFVVEREALRIPSTRNFGLLGRFRVWDSVAEDEKDSVRMQWTDKIERCLSEVIESSKNTFVARKPKGSSV